MATKTSKLPVPPPKQAIGKAVPGSKVDKAMRAEAAKAPVADPKKNGIPPALQVQNRKPLSPQAQAKVAASMEAARKASPEAKQAALRADQKAAKAAEAKAKRVSAKERKQAEEAGATTAMPLSGKAALRAIASAAVANGKPVQKIPAGLKGKAGAKALAATQADGKAKAPRAPGKPRAPRFAEDQTIKVLVKDNPKKAGAAIRFALYRNGMKVSEYVKAAMKAGASESYANADLRWDSSHGWIAIS